MTVFYPAHLARLNRMGLRPAGHSTACTCDICWKAADDAFAEMNRRAEQHRSKSRRRRRVNKKLQERRRVMAEKILSNQKVIKKSGAALERLDSEPENVEKASSM